MVALRAPQAPSFFLPNPTQISVLNLLVQSSSNRAMAAALALSVPTIEYHLTRLMNATGAQNRVGLAVWWRDLLEMPLRSLLATQHGTTSSR